MSTQSQAATDQQPAVRAAGQRTGRKRHAAPLNAATLVPWLVVLLAPALGIVILRAPLLNQIDFLDPWLYSGFGWTLAHHVAIFGWPYYVDRFTVVLPIALSTGLLGPVPAYLVLHYALMAGCGSLLYLAVRRFAPMPVAVAAVCLLMLNPFFVRLMAWDYTTFVSLPCTIAGVGLWYLGSTRARSVWTALGAGICLSAAIYANLGMALVLPALLAIEAIAAIRGGRKDVTILIVRGCVMAAGALLLLIVGYLGYRAYIGSFQLKLMYQATINFLGQLSQQAALYRVAPSIFLRTDPHIYAPVLVCVGTAIVLGRSLFSNTLRSRMAQFAIAYTFVFWVYRFASASSVIESWYYYNVTAVTAAFAMPTILDELGRRQSGRARWGLIAGIAIAVTGLTDLIIRSMSESALNVLNSHTVVLVCVLAACCTAAVLVVVLTRDSTRLIAVAVFCAIVAVIALAPDRNGLTGDFSPYGTTAELEAYRAGYDMTQLIAKYDRPSSRVLLWDDLLGLGSAGWVNLGGHVGTYTVPPVPVLTKSELAMLRSPTTTRVLAVSRNPVKLGGAVPALAREGLRPSLETLGVWTGGRLYYALIRLHTR